MSQQLLHTMQGLEMVLSRSRNSKRLFMDTTEEGAAGYWQHRVVASLQIPLSDPNSTLIQKAAVLKQIKTFKRSLFFTYSKLTQKEALLRACMEHEA
jgi:hypothetical protein